MKKIFTLIVGAMLALGLASCSGDLHDVEDPNTMEGNWFYYELDTSGATTDTINLIFNDGNFQTKDITGVQKTGKVFYMWAAATTADEAIVSLRSDNPNMDLGNDSNKLGVFVFSNAKMVNLYSWSSSNLSGDWPGALMASDTAEKLPTYFVDSIKLINYTEVIGGAGYIAFCEGWLPDNQWDATTPNKVTEADSDGNYVLVFNTPVEQNYVEDATLAIQILNPANDDGFWDNKVGGGTLEAEVPASVVGKHVILVVSVGEDEAGSFAEAELEEK